ncbi:hypothetical protein BJX76DRAFT_328168 [Aspergillus varians]
MVYQEVLVPSSPLHLRRTHRRLCSSPCRARLGGSWGSPASTEHEDCRLPLARDGSVQRRTYMDCRRRDGFLLLIYSCRRIYSESIHVLYAKNKFFLDDHRTLCLLPKVIPTHRLKFIRFLCLQINVFRGDVVDRKIVSSWPKLCTALAKMDGLQDLCIALGSHTRLKNSNPPKNLPALTLLAPLLKVKASRFRVQIPPNCSLNETVGGDEQPFILEVKEELDNNCSCCSSKRRWSALPFPPSWDF